MTDARTGYATENVEPVSPEDIRALSTWMEPRPDPARAAWFDATWDVLLSVLKGTPYPQVVESNIPCDARVKYLVLNHERQSVRVFFASGALDVVPEGGVIPEYTVLLVSHHGSAL